MYRYCVLKFCSTDQPGVGEECSGVWCDLVLASCVCVCVYVCVLSVNTLVHVHVCAL